MEVHLEEKEAEKDGGRHGIRDKGDGRARAGWEEDEDLASDSRAGSEKGETGARALLGVRWPPQPRPRPPALLPARSFMLLSALRCGWTSPRGEYCACQTPFSNDRREGLERCGFITHGIRKSHSAPGPHLGHR